MAEGESTSIFENSKWFIQKRFLNGTFKLSYPPYWYNWNGDQMVISPEQAATVRWIFAQMLSGKGTQAIADELNKKEIPTKRGGHWTATTVRGIIANEKHTSDVIFQKTFTDSQFNRYVSCGEKDRYALANHPEAVISLGTMKLLPHLSSSVDEKKALSKAAKNTNVDTTSQARLSLANAAIPSNAGFIAARHTNMLPGVATLTSMTRSAAT